MIEIRRNKLTRDEFFEIYVNGKLFSKKGYYFEENKLTYLDGFPFFDIKRIAAMKAQDFPVDFCFGWSVKKPYSGLYDNFEITRTQKRITVTVFGFIFGRIHDLEWTLWNPVTLSRQIHLLAKQKKYKISAYSPEDNFRINFDFKPEGTIGELFSHALNNAEGLVREAEYKLQQLAAK